MKLKFITEHEETFTIKLKRYELNTQTEEDSQGRGFYHNQETFKLFVGNIPNELKTLLNPIYDTHVFILYDGDEDGRISKLFSPSIEIKERYIMVTKLKTLSF